MLYYDLSDDEVWFLGYKNKKKLVITTLNVANLFHCIIITFK
jgi:hypothetical protein